MISNLESQKRWISRSKPAIPDPNMIQTLLERLPGYGNQFFPEKNRQKPPNTHTVTPTSVLNTNTTNAFQSTANVTTTGSTSSVTVPPRLVGERPVVEKRQIDDDSDDELDRLLSKRPKSISDGIFNNEKNGSNYVKIGSKYPQNQTVRKNDFNGSNGTLNIASRPINGINTTGTNSNNSKNTNGNTSFNNSPNTSFHNSTKSSFNDSNSRLYEKYISYLEAKCQLLTQRYQIFESSSISLDDKNNFIKNTFTPRFTKVEDNLKILRGRLPNFHPLDLSQISDLEPDTGNSHLETQRDGRQSTPETGPTVHEKAPTPTNPPSPQFSDFSDFEITQINPITLSSDPVEVHVPDSMASVLSLPALVPTPVPLVPTSMPVSVPLVLLGPVPVTASDEEDDFGAGEMDGLRTPTQERDVEDTDLSGFVVEEIDEPSDDSQYDSEIESIEATQFNIDKDELEDIKLSQEVADNFGIKYDGFDDIDQEFMSTQLNDEREINHEIIEIDDESDFEFEPRIKSEQAAQVIDDNDGFDDFDDFDDELIDLGITTSTDIIREQEKNYPGVSYIREIYSVLNKTFKLQNFRSNQFEAIISFLQGRDVFVLMPTGGGKSLCYQLPALVKGGQSNPGVMIVISPLISLMQDQVEHLKAKNIRAGMINSKIEYLEKKHMMELFKTAALDLVYLSPEMINASAQIQKIIKHLYDNKLLNKIVVDEAHCISSWGHDFRPDYKALKVFKMSYPDVPIMALTATANEKVRLDIIHLLNMQNPRILKQSFNRINLYYEIKLKSMNYIEDIKSLLLTKYQNQTGIIYCHSKQLCEQTAAKLNTAGINASFYHAGMSTDDRFKVQRAWQQETIRVICATIAFGMGIDKPNVRFVIHLFLPRNLEGYYQETGRAGRDGLSSDCIMYYSYRDARNLQLMIQKDEEYNAETKENHLNKLRQVIQYCENNHDCRRKQVLQYFNENFDPKNCMKQCDACKTDKIEVVRDFTDLSIQAVKMVKSIQSQNITLLYCQDIFKGSSNSKIVNNGHNKIQFHGAGKELTKLEIERMFFHLVCEDYLMEYSIMKGGFASNYVKIGQKAGELISGKTKILIKFTEPILQRQSLMGFVSAKTNQPINQPINLQPNQLNKPQDEKHIEKSFAELNLIRHQKRIELNFQNANNILSDTSLKRLAIKLPTTKQEFKKYVANNDQANYFIYFKAKLLELSRQRAGVTARGGGTAMGRGAGRVAAVGVRALGVGALGLGALGQALTDAQSIMNQGYTVSQGKSRNRTSASNTQKRKNSKYFKKPKKPTKAMPI